MLPSNLLASKPRFGSCGSIDLIGFPTYTFIWQFLSTCLNKSNYVQDGPPQDCFTWDPQKSMGTVQQSPHFCCWKEDRSNRFDFKGKSTCRGFAQVKSAAGYSSGQADEMWTDLIHTLQTFSARKLALEFHCRFYPFQCSWGEIYTESAAKSAVTRGFCCRFALEKSTV